MKSADYLFFELNGLQYGVETTQIQEIFKLPEFTLIPNAPDAIIGVLNVRTSIIPIFNLSEQLGPSLKCHISDSVIVIAWRDFQIGLVVNHIYDIQSIIPSESELISAETLDEYNDLHFASGIFQRNGVPTILLNTETLIRQPDEVAIMLWEIKLNGVANTLDPSVASLQSTNTYTAQATNNFVLRYCPDATAKEKQTFQQRAFNLSQPLENNSISPEMALAAVRIGKSHIGIFLDHIKEFTNVEHVTSIPCSPTHIVGNMNLRGEIITLVDIRQTLGIAPTTHALCKAMIVEFESFVAGIIIDEVLDIVDLLPTDLLPTPTDIPARYQAFSQGIIQYYQHILTIIDLPKIIFQGNLIVDHSA
ncbi:MAG: chemotaxis protein CheW [Cyanobacteria bacterium P01_D01_bin.56]